MRREQHTCSTSRGVKLKMKRIQSLLIVFITLLFFPAVSHAQQPWSGIISPSRATDWTRAGIVGGIPSGSWTQCGSTIAAYSGTAGAINTAIAACGTNQFVLLGPGTFNLNTAIDFAHKSKVVLRGSGANSTFVVFGSGVSVGCQAPGSTLVCISSSDGTYWVPSTVYNWTAGYAQGATSVTLSSTASINPNSTILILDQCDDGKSGSSCTGTSVDNGNYFNCSDTFASTISGCSFNGPDGGNGRASRFQTEQFQVTAVNSSTGVVTLSRPLRNPNWSSGRSPQAWFVQPIQNTGLENMSIDASADSAAVSTVEVWSCAGCWVKGVRFVRPNVSAVWTHQSVHFQYEQNYVYQAQAGDPFAFRQTLVSDGLIQNNIVQQVRVPILDEGPNNGTVIAYNFLILNYFPADAMFQSIRPHSGGDNYQLMEGNAAVNYYGENYHGSHLMQTAYRNFFTGWESCGSGQCGSQPAKDYQTQAFMLDSYNRYVNAIANVLGTPGYHAAYQDTGTPMSSNKVIFALGNGNGGVSPAVPSDLMVPTTLLRWGNYDTVTGAVRFCGSLSNTGWLATCANTSEVPVGISLYPNQIPTLGDTGAGQSSMPASFYLSSKPAWFGSLPWPPIGPDVSNGNVGACSGTLNTSGQFAGVPATNSSQCAGKSLVPGWAGHVYAIPAMNCALNVMGMPPDGSGGALSFNPSVCYGGSSTSQAPNPPTNLVVVVN